MTKTHIGSWRITRKWWITFGIIGALVVWTIVAGGSKDNKRLEAINACHQFVSRQLKAPAGADYEPDSEAQVTNTGDRWTISGHVDAQNSFGANVRSAYTCEMTNTQGNEYHADNVNVDG